MRLRLSYDDRSAAILVLPVLAVLLVVAAYPILYSFWVSLHDIVLTRPLRRPFVWFENYERMLGDARFHTAVLRTTVYTVVTVTVTTALAVGVALFLNESFRGNKLLNALLLLPWATPSIVNDGHTNHHAQLPTLLASQNTRHLPRGCAVVHPHGCV